MDWQACGVITGFLGLFVTIGVQTMIAMFWAGKFASTIDGLTKSVERLQGRDDLFVKRADYLEQVSSRSKEVADLWKAQNDLRDKFHDCRAKKDCGLHKEG